MASWLEVVAARVNVTALRICLPLIELLPTQLQRLRMANLNNQSPLCAGREYLPFGGLKLIAAAATVVALAGCTTTYTVDDGRKVDEKLLAQIRTYGQGAQAIRPAIVKSAELHDKDCSTQYELPFEAETSYAVKSDDDKVAWVRGLGVDEHLRVIASSPDIALAPGDILTAVDNYDSTNGIKMLRRLMDRRDDGDTFDVKLASGKVVKVTPLKVCRGHVVFAPPGKYANKQDYHWLTIQHPEEIATANLTSDEAEWLVLWSQGLSEEGGVRMKTYTYAMGSIKFVAAVAIGAATAGAGLAAGSAASAAGSALGTLAVHVAVAEIPGTLAQITTAAAANKASLFGVNWAASTAFDKADKWAFNRMGLLGMDPRTGLELQTKLAQAGATHNGLLFDENRLKQMDTLVAALPPAKNTSTATADVPASGVEVDAPIGRDVSASPVGASTDVAPATTPSVVAPMRSSNAPVAPAIATTQ